MGDHKGWRIKARAERGDVLGMVLIAPRSYRSRSFPDKAQARDWAREEAARVCAGLATMPIKATTTSLTADYLKGLAARGRSPSHLANVTRTLGAVSKAAPDLSAPAAALAIERWLDGLKVAPSSRNRMLVEVRALCRWAIRRDLLEKDPTRNIERATVPDVMRAQFTVAEMVRLLSLPTPDPAFHRRLALLLLAGLRSDEAAALTWSDIDAAGGVILIRAHAGHRLKRGRERIVPLQRSLAMLLGEPGTGRVAPLSDTNPRRLFPGYLSACGVEVGERSQHSARHTYAGIMTATGVPGPLLSAYLGHGSAATTMLYTRMAALHVNPVKEWGRGEIRLSALTADSP